MVFKTTSTKSQTSGLTFSELLVATGVTSLVFLVLAAVFQFTGRTCISMSNYFDLDRHSRIALDNMTLELRQARQVVTFGSNQVTFVNGVGTNVQYAYDSTTKQLNRIEGNTTTKLLVSCDWLKFELFQRNPVGGSYDAFYAAPNAAAAKLVQVSWGCSRDVLGAKINMEIVQSSKIVIRKSQD